VREVPTEGAPARDPGSPEVPFRDVLQALVAAVWQLDAFCSLATASSAVGWVFPEIVPRGDTALSLEDVRHPQLPHGVMNDVRVADDERVLFLTGPNMAGKSTLLRAIGIAVYCAHLGMAVAARAARVPLHDRLLVSITVRDNLQRGESLYLAEIRRVRAVVEAVDRGDAVFAIFDEVFRGTNIKDATQATTLLVDGLARAAHGTFVLASHLAEVAESRAGRPGVGCWCMDIDVTGGAPRFTYRVRRGVSDVHLGMVLLDAEGVGAMLRRMAAR
jgi:DNA mismatch repair ATPase MutS